MLELHLDLIFEPLDDVQALLTKESLCELRGHLLEGHTLLEVLAAEGEERVKAVDLNQLL